MMRLALAAVLGLVLACGGPDAAGPGTIEVEWIGGDTGQLRVPASAYWCAGDSVVEISGAAGDSGIAFAVLPRDTVSAGVFPVGMPLPLRSRPGARVAVRWPGETMVEGYYSLSGTVTVDSGADLNGSLEAVLRSVISGRQITLSGTFRDLRVEPGSATICGGTPPAPDDEGMQ